MSAGKFQKRSSLLADVSFADVWRAARFGQLGGYEARPLALDVARASRFAAPAQPFAPEASGAGDLGPEADVRRYRQAA